MKTALIMVDVQNDFIDGTLPVPEAAEILDPLVALAKDVDLVIASRDWHLRGDPRFNHETPHCGQGTQGAKIPGRIRRLADYVVTKGVSADDGGYTAFDAATLRPKKTVAEILKGNEIERVVVGGLALDTTVKWTAFDCAASGYLTLVSLNATRAYTAQGEAEALDQFRKAGVLFA